jgi:hypothetical protein
MGQERQLTGGQRLGKPVRSTKAAKGKAAFRPVALQGSQLLANAVLLSHGRLSVSLFIMSRVA